MRKVIVLFSIMLIAIVFLIGLPVFAAGSNHFNMSDSASIDVLFPLTEIDVNPQPASPEDEESSTYTLIIPASLNLKYEQDFLFQAEDVSLSDGEILAVYIDGAKTFSDDGEFYLYNGGYDETRRVQCHIYRGRAEDNIGQAESIHGANDTLVAEFGDGETLPHTYGQLFMQPNYSKQNTVGTYTGIVYFKIGIEDD
jgi:hypothetical protein